MTFLDVGVLPVACVEKGRSSAFSYDVYHPVCFDVCVAVADGNTPDPFYPWEMLKGSIPLYAMQTEVLGQSFKFDTLSSFKCDSS